MQSACCVIRTNNQSADFKHRSWSWRQITAWGMLDFSNSIVLMVLGGQYQPFVQRCVYPLADQDPNAVLPRGLKNFLYANIVVSVLTCIMSPPVGALIDKYFIRVPIVLISIIGYSVPTMVLYVVEEGDLVLPIVMYALGMFFFRFNEMVTGAFLPSLCNERDVGFVSGYGYFVGYVSGIMVLLLTRLLTTPDDDVDMTNIFEVRAWNIEAYKTTMIVVGIIQLLSGLPPILMLDNGVPEGEKRPKWYAGAIKESFVENVHTIKNGFKVNRVLSTILVMYFILGIGISGNMAYQSQNTMRWANLGKDFEPLVGDAALSQNDLQDIGVIFNVVMGISSLVYAYLTKKIGYYWIVIFQFVVVIVACSMGFWYRELPYDKEGYYPGKVWAWTYHILFGISHGPVQAILRGAIGLLTPPEKKGEIFGCFESLQLLGGIVGSSVPATFIFRKYWAHSLWTGGFFFIALIFWIFIPIRREERKIYESLLAAKQEEEEEEEEEEAEEDSSEESDDTTTSSDEEQEEESSDEVDTTSSESS